MPGLGQARSPFIIGLIQSLQGRVLPPIFFCSRRLEVPALPLVVFDVLAFLVAYSYFYFTSLARSLQFGGAFSIFTVLGAGLDLAELPAGFYFFNLSRAIWGDLADAILALVLFYICVILALWRGLARGAGD